MTAAFIIIGLYLVYLAIPRGARKDIAWHFWAVAIGGAVLFAAWSLLKTGSLPEPASGQSASPTRLSALR